MRQPANSISAAALQEKQQLSDQHIAFLPPVIRALIVALSVLPMCAPLKASTQAIAI